MQLSERTERETGYTEASARASAPLNPRRLSASLALIVGWCFAFLAWLATAIPRQPLCLLGGDTYETSRCRPEEMITPRVDAVSIAFWCTGSALFVGLWLWDRRRARREVSTPPGRLRAGWMCAAVLIGVVIGGHVLLFAPASAGKPWGAKLVHPTQHTTYAVNTDSRIFVELAHSPGKLLEPRQVRQSRPGYVAISVVATKVAAPIIRTLGLDRRYKQRDPAYLAMVAINFMALAAAIAIFIWLMVRLGTAWPIVVALSVLLMFNEVTRAFLWTPHQQMFGLLTPVLTVLLGRQVLLRTPNVRQAVLLGSGLGLGLLVYGNILITVAVVGLLLLVRMIRTEGPWRLRLRSVGLPLVIVGLLAAAPTLAWIQVCKAVAGSYYNHEVTAYHQFVWIIESARDGADALLTATGNATTMTAAQLIQVGAVLCAVLIVLVASAVLTGTRLTMVTPEQRATMITTIVTVGLSVAFLWSMGFWRTRITYCLVPLLLIIIGWVAGRLYASSPVWRRALVFCMAAGSVVWMTVELTSVGPFA